MKKVLTLVLILSMCLVGFGLPTLAGEERPAYALDCVVLSLKPEYSTSDYIYTPADFPEIDCEEVQSPLHKYYLSGVMDDFTVYGGRENYRRILVLILADKTEQGVLAAIEGLLLRDDVYSAGKAGLLYPDDDVDDEGKVLSTTTLEDDFIPGSVVVILKNKPSLEQLDTERKYTLSDFPEVAGASIRDITEIIRPLVKNQRDRQRMIDAGQEPPSEPFANGHLDVELDQYRAMLQLTLKDESKEGVLQAIAVLQKRDDVYCVCADFMLYPAATYPGEWNAAVNGTAWNPPRAIIQAPDAWSMTTGSSGTLVAVIDSGIDSTHPDLAGNVNASLGAVFANDGIPLTMDPSGHGTHVAGIIGARENNSGVTGVSWNVTLVPIRVFGATGGCRYTQVADSLMWAKAKGITIANFSGGGPWSDALDMEAMEQAIANFGGLLICCAGNSAADIDAVPYYPASLAYNNIIAVANSTNTNTRSANSNYGVASVDLFAPGTDIVSTLPGGVYKAESGTSMSTPFVTGTVALIRSKYPALTNAQIKSAILCGVDTYAAFSGKCVTGGRLNAYTSLYLAGHCYTLETSLSRVKNIQPGVSVATFTPQMRVTSLSYNSEMVVRTGGFMGAIKTSGLVATGDYAQAKRNGAVVASYTVLIRGDVYADGCIDIDDLLTVQAEIFETLSLTDVYSVAADANRDGVIDIDDILAIRNHMFGIAQINQR